MPPRIQFKNVLLSLMTVVLTVTAGSARADLINFQILGHATNSKGGPDQQPAIYQGAGVIGSEGDYWNGVVADVFGQPLKIVRPWKILAADGKTFTGVKLKFSGFIGADHWPVSDGAPINNPLLNSYLVGGASASVMIAGLTPDAAYDLCLFSSNSHAGAGAKFAVNGSTPQSTQGTEGTVFAKGVDYVEFKDVHADEQGRIRITLDVVDPGKFATCIFNGLQLRGEFPLPMTQPQQPDNGSWAIKFWLKADDLADAGLKPGDPVAQWKDASWEIRFSPNPKIPYNDKAPIYAEINVPGNPNPTPVVQFDSNSSLRQVDLLDVVDEQQTVFAVYWSQETDTKTWKQLLVKRNGVSCTYSGGIATPLNPTLTYTVYNESGVRLGANDTLPLAIAGHQGEHNLGGRFKGYIAEVIVFAKLFAPDDEQQEIVESYLYEKYYNVTRKDNAAPEAPWSAEKSAYTAVPVNMAEKSALPPDIDNGLLLNQANIFSQVNQEDAATTEYAAGDITLPFSYSASVSTAPRPECLNFEGWPNPDCSHVFVRIDGELWMFRIAWIIGKGIPERYKGPDIDHMTRVEDGKYPPEIGLGWFLGGMWYNESERKLYAPVHIEQEGSYRFHPAGGWFSRKIALATSVDKGKTWKYEGDIITPETYYFTHDVYKFSGSYYGNGVCDFGFYVDTRSGYFYIFPEESWYKKGEFGAIWGVRAARCAISDKMAPGKWKYFYNGKWDEPALGGKSTMVAPSHFWGVMYSTYLDRYICMFPSNGDPGFSHNIDGVMIGTCSDLAKQDWVWGYCPEPMFGFMKLFNAEGTDTEICGQILRHYGYFAGNTFRRVDITLEKEPMAANNWMPRYSIESHPESSDPILSRKTKNIGSSSPETLYSGTWSDVKNDDAYERTFKESNTAGSSIEFSFTGSDVYWRAVRSPKSGKADVYIDGVLRKIVDCFSPRSTSYEVFVYLKTGLDPNINHTIKIVVKDEKNPESEGTAIGHIAFEYSAESYKASAGFCSLMGKNNWYYQQRKDSTYSDMRFIPRDDVFVKDWFGQGNIRIGNNYQIPDGDVESVRKWIAPHGGTVRIEGKAELVQNNNKNIFVQILKNSDELWKPNAFTYEQPASHDLTVKVKQDDTVCFIAGIKTEDENAAKVLWDPVITYTQSIPAVWKPNPPSNQNLALGKYGRSKMLVYTYQPFNAVDGDMETNFTIYPDDKISSGDDWLQLDLDKKYVIDRYVVVSNPKDSAWRPVAFSLQKSDDRFVWTDVDSVTNNTRERVERDVAPFTSRYVRLYLPNGKPFSITEFELYHTKGKK